MKNLILFVLFVLVLVGVTSTVNAQSCNAQFYSPKSPCYRTKTVVRYVNNPDTVANTAVKMAEDLERNKLNVSEFNNYASNNNARWNTQDSIDKTQNDAISREVARADWNEFSRMWLWVIAILGLLAGIVAILVALINRGHSHQVVAPPVAPQAPQVPPQQQAPPQPYYQPMHPQAPANNGVYIPLDVRVQPIVLNVTATVAP